MSELLGRPLRPGKSVHHRNLLKSDNRTENLELWTSHQPKGARVADMLAWCRWFISEYSEAAEQEGTPDGLTTSPRVVDGGRPVDDTVC
jgi:hypothetical protein